MLLPISAVAREVDSTDLSDLTTAKRTGPAAWAEGGLEIPFDRDLTQTEMDAVVLRLTTSDDSEEQFRKAAAAFLSKSAPTTTEQRTQVKALTQLVLKLLDRTQTQPGG